MPRDSSGNMTLAKPPFVAGVASSAPDLNSDLADIAAELSDSLSRSGKGGLTSPLKFLDGTEPLPAITFTSEPSSGWYRIAANILGLAIAGVEKLRATLTGLSLSEALEFGGAGAQSLFKTTAGGLRFGTAAGGGAVDLYSEGVARASLKTSGSIGFGNYPLQECGTPVGSADAATKGYVDSRFGVAALVTGATAAIVTQVNDGTHILGGATHVGAGVYSFTLTGVTANAILNASLAASVAAAGMIRCVANGAGVFVWTYDAAGNPQDRDFHVHVVSL